MSNIFEKLKFIDNRIKDTVFGYVRSNGKQLSLHNIPALISYITLNYYYHNEYFAKYGQQVNVSNNMLSVTKVESIIDKFHNTTYGNTWIDTSIPQIAKWTLSASVGSNQGSGVTLFWLSKDNRIDDVCYRGSDYRGTDDECYGVFQTGWRISSCSRHDETTVDFNGDGNLFGGEPFVITFNTKKKTISLQKVGTSDIITIYDDIKTGKNIKYKLGILLFQTGDAVSLLKFDMELE